MKNFLDSIYCLGTAYRSSVGLLLLLAINVPYSVMASNTGIQTNFGDKSFAGGMVWEPMQDLLYVTGQVGPNGCWVGILKRSNMQFLSKVVLPEPAICQGIIVGKQESMALVLATTEEGGLFTNTRVTGSTKATQYGLVLPVQWQDGKATKAPKLPPGLLLHEDAVQYPRAIVADPVHKTGEYVYVASLHSESKALTEDFRTLKDAPTPNLTPSGVLKFGTEYFLQVERIRVNPVGETLLKADWRKPFGLSPIPSYQKAYSVHLGTMIWNQGSLVVVGSTRGGGLLFGDVEEMNSNVTNSDHGYCMNGFISKLDPTNGQPVRAGSSSGTVHQRYSQGSDADTYIEAVCGGGGNDSKDLFVVGRYIKLNNGKSIAFLAKLDADSLETEWQKDFAFTQHAYGLACGVVTQGEDGTTPNAVYMAGMVEGGGTFGSETTSLGQDDLFVLKVQINDGHVDWLNQVGTQGNDRLAHGGSGLLAVKDGVVLFGDTTGDWQATNHKGTEIFVVEIQTDGSISWTTTETSGTENTGGSVQIQVSKRTDNDEASDGTNEGRPPPGESDRTPIIEKGGTGGGIGMILAIAVLAVALIAGYIVRSRKKEKVTERALVFSYLQAFDLEDVEVRHSATGGWHGTYVGELAKGNDTSASRGLDGGSNRLSHSSIVSDSLFVDYEKPRRRYNDDDDDDEDPESNIDDSNNFRIGSEDDDEDDEYISDHDDDQDFEQIGQLEEQFASNPRGGSSNNPWGRDII